jgi:ectoine hydroxylase-related dioxygenase (phytanoyl-CoA dioxygenase family)
MKPTAIPLAEPTETGALGVYQLKRLWSRVLRQRHGQPANAGAEAQVEHVVLDALGLGLEQTLQYLFQTGPSFAEFEQWILATSGGVSATQLARINAMVTGAACPPETARWLAEVAAEAPVLSAADLAFWDEHGYVVVPDAVPETSRAAATQAILDHLGASADDPESWYKPNDHGIMVQFFQHPAFTANRQSRRVHKAFAQLWRTADLWVSTDRAGFNVPERPGWKFRGPDLHWDVSLARPIPFGTQGILYLTDTEPEQGALTLVPGFHRRLDAWLDFLPPGADPRRQDLHALGSKPIAGRAGDLIIWHHALPHGSRPNRATRPRIVQYLNMRPARMAVREPWI